MHRYRVFRAKQKQRAALSKRADPRIGGRGNIRSKPQQIAAALCGIAAHPQNTRFIHQTQTSDAGLASYQQTMLMEADSWDVSDGSDYNHVNIRWKHIRFQRFF